MIRQGNLLDDVFAPGALTVRFQPIFQIAGGFANRVLAMEGLVRGPIGTNLERADILFEYARRKRRQGPLDRLAFTAVLSAATPVPADCSLSINVHASTLGQESDFVEFLSRALASSSITFDRLVVEIVEHMGLWDSTVFLRTIEKLRALGVHVAMDDVGIGHSNFQRIIDCRPDYLKIDRYFIKNVDADASRQAVVEAVVLLADRMGAVVVAEGVETLAELEAICTLGVTLAQGNGLCAAGSLDEVSAAIAPAALKAFHGRPLRAAALGRQP